MSHCSRVESSDDVAFLSQFFAPQGLLGCLTRYTVLLLKQAFHCFAFKVGVRTRSHVEAFRQCRVQRQGHRQTDGAAFEQGRRKGDAEISTVVERQQEGAVGSK